MTRLLFLLILGVAAFAGYRYLHPEEEAGTPLGAGSPPALAAAASPTPGRAQAPLDPQTGRAMVPCDFCHGVGTVKCRTPHCVEGWVDCPGHCLKLTVGRWEHLTVAGHDPSELWQKFTYPGGYQAWTTAHVGQVIEYQGGRPVNVGNCPICSGKGKVPDPVCQGTGQIVCGRCHGAKFIPAKYVVPAAPTAGIKLAVRPLGASPAAPLKKRNAPIRLKNGTVLNGQIVIDDGETVWIRKETGEQVQLPKSRLK